jgi:hypothetical protein
MIVASALPWASLENEFVRIDYLTSLGPRIVGLYAKKARLELFAKTPDAHWRTPHGEYYLHGGHRLWTAPEDPFHTCPEDNVQVRAEKQRVSLRSRVDSSGLEKEISFHLEDHRVRLFHRITWHGKEPVELAPWPITQMRLGGIAILPQSVLDTGLSPNRNLVFWPYSRLDDERLELDDDLVLLHGRPAARALKIGMYNPYGCIAYLLDGTLFVKRFAVDTVRAYPDMGSNAEVYVKDSCVELETLGVLTRLEPQEAVCYEETWEILTGNHPHTMEAIRAISTQLFSEQTGWHEEWQTK